MAAKKKVKSAQAMAVKSAVQGHLKSLGNNTAGDVYQAVDSVVSEALNKASARAAANGRKTVRASDF